MENTHKIDENFTQKMKGICENTVNDITDFFRDKAIEAHLFGSMARGTNDALSDIDIWLTFEDEEIDQVLVDRFATYEQFGEIILWHEMQNNFPLDGIQTAIIYKINDGLVRVDFYLCPFSSSRVLPDSKILFERKKVEVGSIIPETKRTPRDLSDRITFFISMCFNGIKYVVRNDPKFVNFLIGEFKKYQKELPQLASIPNESSFGTLRMALEVLDTVSNQEQKKAISEINQFMTKVESLLIS
ncbi:MAG: nucleotidyltransferase domain-containing protein [Minisyncoccia bacterium]